MKYLNSIPVSLDGPFLAVVNLGSLLCFSSLRRAKEIVLKFEGRLTRTRGYQAAGAEVKSTPCPGPHTYLGVPTVNHCRIAINPQVQTPPNLAFSPADHQSSVV